MIIIYLLVILDLLFLGLGIYGLHIDNSIICLGAGVVGTGLVSTILYFLMKDI